MLPVRQRTRKKVAQFAAYQIRLARSCLAVVLPCSVAEDIVSAIILQTTRSPQVWRIAPVAVTAATTDIFTLQKHIVSQEPLNISLEDM